MWVRVKNVLYNLSKTKMVVCENCQILLIYHKDIPDEFIEFETPQEAGKNLDWITYQLTEDINKTLEKER